MVILVIVGGLALLGAAGTMFYLEIRKDRELAKSFNDRVDKVVRGE